MKGYYGNCKGTGYRQVRLSIPGEVRIQMVSSTAADVITNQI